MTLAEVFRRKQEQVSAELEQRQAYEATPDGQAEVAAREAYHRRLAEADARFAAANPPDSFQEGRDASLAGAKAEPPDDLSEEAADLWLKGWDSTGSDED